MSPSPININIYKVYTKGEGFLVGRNALRDSLNELSP